MWKKVAYLKSDGTPGYDDAGYLVRMVDPEGHAFDYAYDDEHRLREIRRTPQGGTSTLIASYAYYVSGLRREVTLDGGTRHTYHYDARLRLTSLETARADGAVLAQFVYDYDARDRRTRVRMQHLANEVTYGYDCHDRLTSETWTGNSGGSLPCQNQTAPQGQGNVSTATSACAQAGTLVAVPPYSAIWTYDAAGNRLTKTVGTAITIYEYNVQNRLTRETPPTPAQPIDYGYDRNGNQASRTQGGTVESFGYDYMNRVRIYQRIGVSWLYRYAPAGERLAKVNLLGATDNEEWLMYDGQDVTADYARTTGGTAYQLRRTYVNGRAIDSKIARIDAGSVETVTYFVGDALGSVHEMMDSSGAITQRVLNTAWGEGLPGFGPLAPLLDRHGFTQRERDDESALMHFRARSYDPRLGRFIQPDPILANRPAEHHAYARSNPLSYRDPSGMYVELTESEENSVGSEGKVAILELLNIKEIGGGDWAWDGRRLQGNRRWDCGPVEDVLSPRRGPYSLEQLLNAIEKQVQPRHELNNRLGVESTTDAHFLELGLMRKAAVDAGAFSLATGTTMALIFNSAFLLWGEAVVITSVAPTVPLTVGVGGTVAEGSALTTAIASAASTPAGQRALQTAQVTTNRLVGNAFRDQLATFLESRGFEVAKEVYVKTPFGRRFIDLSVSRGGKVLEYVETKTGGSKYGVEQRAKDLYIKLVKGIHVTLVRQQ